MEKTALPNAPDRPPVSDPGSAPRPRRAVHPVVQILKPIASLKLTVVLFVLSLVLVFCGTLAQMDHGIWTVLHAYFRSFIVWIPFQLFIRFGNVFLGIPAGTEVPGAFPFPGGWLLGALLLLNLVAAHMVRFKFRWNRAGILLIHAGLIILMLGELVTGLYAVEGRMSIDEGRSSNYVEDYHATELAVIDSSDPTEDQVVVIPGSLLARGGVISNEQLPFDVEVLQYQPNSSIKMKAEAGDADNPADAGDGLQVVAVDAPLVSGTGSEIDIPSAYVTFKDKNTGEPMGTFLMSVWLSRLRGRATQPVMVDGKKYDVGLRFRRTYKPYQIYLKDFKFDRYVGTDKPKNYSSDVRVIDPQRHEDRAVTIRMNEPLRYRGETFYQVGFDEVTEKGTILQVVDNPGWLLPYVSCTVVSLGMLIHFGMHLVGFVRRRFAV